MAWDWISQCSALLINEAVCSPLCALAGEVRTSILVMPQKSDFVNCINISIDCKNLHSHNDVLTTKCQGLSHNFGPNFDIMLMLGDANHQESRKMSKLNTWLEGLIPDAQAVLRRFPFAALMVLALTIIVIIQANDHDFFSDQMMMRLVGGVVLAGYTSIILTLASEGRGKPFSILIKAIAVGGALLLSWFFRELAFVTPMAIGASVLFLGSAAFWRQNRNDVAVWDFTHKLWSAVIFTVAGAIIYMIGMFAISAALKSLFGLNIRNIIEDWLFPIGFAFLAPMAWMSMLPKHDEDDTDSLRNPGFISRAVGFLGTWILAPMTLIYAAILLAYGAKILLTQTLPNGEIAQLVTPFLIVGTLTWLILDPPFIQEKRLARWFGKFWFPLMIPAAILLAASVLIRIGQYGWTIERYLLVLASIWALGIALWFTFRGETNRDIRIIPGFAALLLAIGSIGPWGADGFSSINQNARLSSALQLNNMIGADGKLKPASDIMITDEKASIKAKGALNYLIKQRKAKTIAKYLPAGDTTKLSKDSEKLQRLNTKNIMNRFALSKVQMPSRYRKKHGVVNYYNMGENILSVKGYEYISARQSQNLARKNSTHSNKTKLGDYIVRGDKAGDIVVMHGPDEVSRTDMLNWIKGLGLTSDNSNIPAPKLVLYTKDEVEIALYLVHANYSKNDEVRDYAFAEYMLLTKGIEIEIKPNP